MVAITLLRAEDISINVRFRGGQITRLTGPRPIPMEVIRGTKPEVVATLDRLLETHTDQQAAHALNALGYRNWRQQLFTSKKVISVRCAYKLKGGAKRLLDRGFVRADDLAKRFGVSVTTIHEWGRQGLLRRQRYDNNVRCLYEPVDSVMIRKGQGGRRPIPPTLINARPFKQEAL